jgi:predicted phosphodiesterase
MRAAIISDIHANHAALCAVIADARQRAIRRLVCLGDLVGYNSFPSETLALMRAEEIRSVHGNHDLMAVGRLEPDDCGPNGRAAMLWTRAVLSDDDVEYLRGLPDHLRLAPGVICIHSGLGDPVIRLSTADQFREQLAKLRRLDDRLRLCFTGHTHVPRVLEVAPTGTVVAHMVGRLQLRDGSFYFINPGSVGHPRGSDYRASYAVYDGGAATVAFHRIGYDRRRVIEENARHGIYTDLGPSVAAYAMQRTLNLVPRAYAKLKASL